MTKAEFYRLLDDKKLDYQVYEHPAVFTMEELYALDIPRKEQIVKNLFLRDDKKRNYYLVTVAGNRTTNLRTLSERIPSRKLSFAGEDKLLELLGLEKGHVTPVGALHEAAGAVTVVFDQALQGKQIGIHPMENTATVFVALEDVVALLEERGNPVVICHLDD